jgi:hypothetical protein
MLEWTRGVILAVSQKPLYPFKKSTPISNPRPPLTVSRVNLAAAQILSSHAAADAAAHQASMQEARDKEAA